MARSQFAQVHVHQIDDLEVDTSVESAQEIAAKIKAYSERVLWPQAFRRIRNEKIVIDRWTRARNRKVLLEIAPLD